MLNITVDMNKCQHYGQCVLEAPNIFKLNDEDRLEWVATAEVEERANIEAAIDVCPMQAIALAD